MKIILILSASEIFIEAARIGKPNKSYAPTTLIHLASLVPEELDADVECIDLAVTPLPALLHADLVGISTITCGAPAAYRIAQRAKSEGITVVMGGTHPSVMPQEALLYADSVVVGQADRTWPQLLRDFALKKMKRIYTDEIEPENDFKLVPLNRTLYKKGDYRFTNCIETTYGCPNTCRFCAVKNHHKNAIHRNIDNLTKEINDMGKHLLFLDSNHTEFPDFNNQFWPILKSMNKQWFCASSMRFASDEKRVQQAAQSGLRGVLIGFESVNQLALSNMNKGFNTVEQYYDSVKRLHDNGIIILGNFIFGFDEDDESIFDRTVEFTIKTKIDIVRYALLTPLPGTQHYRTLQEQNRIVDTNWGHYDTDHVVFKPQKLTSEALVSGLAKAYKDTYTYRSIIKRINWTGSTTAISIGGNFGFRQLSQHLFLGLK